MHLCRIISRAARRLWPAAVAAALAAFPAFAGREGQVVRGLDGQSWVVASHQTTSGVTMSEYIRHGQTPASAQEHYTVMKMPGTTDAAAMAQQWLSLTKAGCATFTGETYWADTADTFYEWRGAGCAGSRHRAEHAIVRLLRMDDGVYRLSYAWRGESMPDASRAQWLKLIGEAWRQRSPQAVDAAAADGPAPAADPAGLAAATPSADARARLLADELAKEFGAIYPGEADPAKLSLLSRPSAAVHRDAALHRRGADGSAGEPTTSYRAGEDHYAVISILPADKGKTLRGLWRGPESLPKNPFYEQAIVIDGKGDHAFFAVESDTPFPPGEYTFEAVLDGEPVSRLSYQVLP